MTREMGQIDTADYLRDMGIEPVHDPLHAGEPEDQSRIKEVKDSVNWAKRLTYNADGISQKAIDAIINSRSIGIVGKDAYTGETDVALATPQFTANTYEAQRKVMKSIRSRLKVVINNAARSRMITFEKADRLIDEVPVRVIGSRFQPHKEPRPYQKEPERKNVYSGGYTRNEQTISGPKKAVLVIAGSTFLLSSCAVVPTAVETAVATATQQAATQSVDVPIGVPTEMPKSTPQAEKTPTPDVETRAPVTAEDVKNVEDPIHISLDKSGKLTGFPENTPQADIDAAKPFFDAIAAKFLLSKIFYTKDPVSGQFALYAVSPDGKLYFSTVSYSDGPAQFNDYPVTYESKNNGWQVSGSYVGIDIPGGTWSTIWKNGFLQFIADKKDVSDGYMYTKYMVNQTLASEDPWQSVPGLAETPAGPEIADALDVNNYQIVDGNIQEKRGNSWQEVNVPYEEGYIAYVEIHDGKAYGIDTADRAVVVRNDSGEWVKFERPIFGADFDKYVYEDESNIYTRTIDQSNLDLSDVPITEINRLNDSEGNNLKWGYLGDTKDWNTSYNMFDFITSGYFLDVANIHTKNYSKILDQTVEAEDPPAFVFEIPHKYYRQVVLVYQVSGDDMLYVMTGNYPDASETYQIQGSKINKYLLENINTMRGQQIVLNLNLQPSSEYSQLFWNSQLTENNGYTFPSPMATGFFWFSSNFPVNKIQ